MRSRIGEVSVVDVGSVVRLVDVAEGVAVGKESWGRRSEMWENVRVEIVLNGLF